MLKRVVRSAWPLILGLAPSFMIASGASADDLSIGPTDSGPTRNFVYVRGERSWLDHVPTQVTTTFEALLAGNTHMRSLVCCGDSSDLSKIPFRRVKSVCMQGRGAKMVVPIGYPTFLYEVFMSPSVGGLFEQAHMTERVPRHFYDTTSRFMTKFFLLPFDEYEVPVYSVDDTREFLPLWKRLFLSDNKMERSYFDSHIRVIGMYRSDFLRDSIPCEYMNVAFVYYVDWVQIELNEQYMVKSGRLNLADVIDTLDPVSSYNKFEKSVCEGRPPYWLRRQRFVPSLDHVITQFQVVQIVDGASPNLGFDVNGDIRLSQRGDLTLGLRGVADWDANKCLRAELSLKDGSISDVIESACWVE
jgi:hypothetical protein